MGHEELKTEIIKLLDNIPDVVLEKILVVLKDIEAKSKISDDHRTNIFSEDKELFQKLAQ